MLVIYIPGHHFQFVDCTIEHDPCPGLYLPGFYFLFLFLKKIQKQLNQIEMSPMLPHSNVENIPISYVTHFEISSNDQTPFGLTYSSFFSIILKSPNK